MGSQKVVHLWATELNSAQLNILPLHTAPNHYDACFGPEAIALSVQS